MRSLKHAPVAPALALCAAVIAVAEEKKDDLLPLAEGRKWTYEVRKVVRTAGLVRAKKQGTATCVCLGKQKIGDEELWTFEWSGDNDDAPRGLVWVREGGARVVVVKSTAKDLPLVPVDPQAKTAQATVASDGGSIQVDSSVAPDEEEVETPAGKFRCVKVTATSATGKVVAKRMVWYARGVGVVRILKQAETGSGISAEKEIVLVSHQ